jgi:hypothetical protein
LTQDVFRNRLVVGERCLGDLADEQRRIGARPSQREDKITDQPAGAE